jgi:flagellar biosynthesis protein FlhF
MLHETFRGRDLSQVLAEIRARLGHDALVLRTRAVRREDGARLEVVATTAEALESFRRRLEREPIRLDRGARAAGRPHVVALVGSTGAGKTTTVAKLALHPAAFGGRRVGVITLDTYRVGALEQIQTYADVVGLPLEVVYDEREIPGALRRLAACDVVLVDTPGRSPRAGAAGHGWRRILRALGPDEVHLVMPAGLRPDVARATRDLYASCGTTHLLLTKLDEVPAEEGAAELADEIGLPARWVAFGQEVPADLDAAPDRLLASLCRETDPALAMETAV